MSVYLHYGNLEDSIKRSEKIRKQIDEYVSKIGTKVTNKISELPGNDSSGYAGTAANLARQKANALNAKKAEFQSFETAVNDVIATAKQEDNKVANRIQGIVDLCVGKRNVFQKIGDWFYETFCVKIVNSNGILRTISNVVDRVGNAVGNALERAKDCFKYGNGKYVLNFLKDIAGVVVAIGAVIAAIAALPTLAGAALVVGIVSLVCASVSAVITVGNNMASAISNGKALALSDSPSAARYYGEIGTLSDLWNKTDMGNQRSNERYEIAGNVIDTTKTVADIGQLVTGLATLGYVKNFTTGKASGLDFSLSNIKRNILHNMKIYTSKVDNKNIAWYEKINWKEVIDPKAWFGGYSKSKFKVDKQLIISEKAFHFLNTAKIFKATVDTNENIGNIIDMFAGKEDATTGIKSILEILEGISFTEDAAKTTKDIIDIAEDVNDYIENYQ